MFEKLPKAGQVAAVSFAVFFVFASSVLALKVVPHAPFQVAAKALLAAPTDTPVDVPTLAPTATDTVPPVATDTPTPIGVPASTNTPAPPPPTPTPLPPPILSVSPTSISQVCNGAYPQITVSNTGSARRKLSVSASSWLTVQNPDAGAYLFPGDAQHLIIGGTAQAGTVGTIVVHEEVEGELGPVAGTVTISCA